MESARSGAKFRGCNFKWGGGGGFMEVTPEQKPEVGEAGSHVVIVD